MPQRTNRSYFRTNTKIINADGSIVPGDRFLSTDEPTEETFKRLIESCAFISEKDDAASTSQQGLVKTTSGANAKAGTTPDDGFTYVPKISNLPTVAEAVQTIGSLVNKAMVTVTKDAGATERNAYQLKLSQEFVNWLTGELDSLASAISAISVPDISGILSDITAIQGDLTNINSTLSSYGNRITTAESEIDTLQTEMDAVEAKAQANEDAIAALGSNDGSVVGEMKFMPINSAPGPEYLLCNGQAVSRTTYSALFSLIGTTFGAGDGSSTFNLPNFSGKGFRGYNAANETDFGVGVSKGSDSVTIGAANLPVHSHGFTGTATELPLADAAGSSLGSVAKGDDTGTDTYDITPSGTVENNSTTNDPMNIANPYLTVFVFIKS